MRALFFIAIFLSILAGGCYAESSAVDVEHSTLTIRVFKSGLFSGFAHDHEIAAPLTSGAVDLVALSVEVHFDVRKLKVLDADASPGDRGKIQDTMLSDKVLDATHFTEIVFRSRRVTPAGENAYAVEGDLTLHGVTRQVALPVSLRNGHYAGSVKLKQTDFGITPISLAGGSVKVKDAVEISFDIALQTK